MKYILILCLLFSVECKSQTQIKIDDGTGRQLTQKVQSLSGASKTIKWPGTNGTSGYVLTTDGANPAILSWSPASGSLTSAVIINPALSTRNLIKPTTDAIALRLQNFNAGSTAFLQTWEYDNGSSVATTGSMDNQGNLILGSVRAMGTAPGVVDLVLQNPDDATLFAKFKTMGGALIADIGSGGEAFFTSYSSGGLVATSGLGLLTSDALGTINLTPATNGQLLIGNTTTGNVALSTLTAGSGITITNAPGAITIASTVTGGVTSISAGTGITLTPNPIVSTGSVAITNPLPSGTTTNSTLRWNGSAWVETTNVLSQAAGDFLSKTTVQAWGQFTTGGPNNGVDGIVEFANAAGTKFGLLTINSLTTNPTWSLPDATGTIALTTDIPSGSSYIKNQTASQSSASYNIANNVATVANIASTYTAGTATALTLNANAASSFPNQGLTFNITNGASNNDIVGTSGLWQVTSGGNGTFNNITEACTTGDLLYASATNTLSKRSIGSTGNVLTVTGGVPVWAAPATTSTTAQTIDIEGIASTSTDGLTIENLTAATSSVPQWSPREHFIGKLWNSASQSSDWIIENQTNISTGSTFAISQATNGGTYLPELTIQTDNSGLAPTFALGGKSSASNGVGVIINMGVAPTGTSAGGDAVINGQTASGVNQFGGNFIVQVGRGTGNKNGQAFVVRSSHSGAGASTLNTATQMMNLTPSGTASTNPAVTLTIGNNTGPIQGKLVSAEVHVTSNNAGITIPNASMVTIDAGATVPFAITLPTGVAGAWLVLLNNSAQPTTGTIIAAGATQSFAFLAGAWQHIQ